MSLNRTLDRLFEEIRREAKRNPGFADRLDAVLRLHESRRDVPDEAMKEAARAPGSGDETEPPAKPKRPARASAQPINPRARAAGAQRAPSINPVSLYKKGGEAALIQALASQDLRALRSLVAEHNLDPSGVTPALTRDELASHILAQAKRRAERDDRMFDY